MLWEGVVRRNHKNIYMSEIKKEMHVIKLLKLLYF